MEEKISSAHLASWSYCRNFNLQNCFFMKKRYICIAVVLLINNACKRQMEKGNETIEASRNSSSAISALSSSAVDYWLTKGDQSVLLQQQPGLLFGTTSNRYSNIVVDTTQVFQSIDGFGYTLTTSSAYVINRMSTAAKSALLQELFGTAANSIGVSYLRVNVGASDLSPTVYSYDDLPAGQTDPTLQNFSLAPDEADMIPVLQQILSINPTIKIFGSPWSPPTWMKNNSSSVGGSLLSQYYSTFANYMVKYIQGMNAKGITINAITPQNEPLNPNNNPSMYMPATQQDTIIKFHLGPALQSAGLSTKIILYDHNCDHPEYPTSILDDAAARGFVDGSAFHLYAGNISALTTVHNAYPTKNVYFTEQFTGSTGNFGNDLKWHLKNVITGSMRNWSRVALEWNLANDPNYGPHTPGGCTTCKGAVTINGSAVTRNVAYYIVAHASKFVPTGSVRISSTQSGSLYNVAFKRPDGKKVLIVENDGHSNQSFNIKFNGQWATSTLPGGAVATYVW
jgi:glucosylceramidase